MDQQEVKDLLEKYNQNSLNPQEKSRLDSWYIYQSEKNTQEIPATDLKEVMARLKTTLPLEYAVPIKTYKLWPRIKITAAAIATIVFGVWFYNSVNNHRHPELVSGSPSANDIAPGRQGATLMLANGKSIRLSDAINGKIANEAGVEITKTEDGQLVYNIKTKTLTGTDASVAQHNTLHTAKGETYQVRLPDGTKVWLNAASSISYSPTLTADGHRSIQLDGEAYFEVVKDKANPFIVTTKRQEVRVLGTHFNINAYTDEKEVKTTLLEGRVRVVSLYDRQALNPGAKTVILLPDQQSILSGTGQLQVAQVDVEQAIAWKQGKFRFENANLETVLREMSRWYNVEIVYANGIPERTFTGDIDRNLTAAEALSILQFTKVNFKIQGQQIIVTK
jgi:transmembrane sensor